MAAAKEKIDRAIEIIASYADNFHPRKKSALECAGLCLADALSCALSALRYKACRKLLGPFFPDAIEEKARIIATPGRVDPIAAAFNMGTMIRFLDFNDTYLGKEWAHPSDNLGGLLTLADYLDRTGRRKITLAEFLKYLIKAYEIQGILAEENCFHKIGFDHVIFVKIATAAIATKMLGGSFERIASAVSNAFIDMGPLRAYRHTPNVGSRKAWAAGDATARGLFLALLANRGFSGYPKALTAEKWGLYDLFFGGQPFVFRRKPGSFVVENILFKPLFPAEFHAQTAVEAAITMHNEIKGGWKEIEKITIDTQKPAMEIIAKTGLLRNAADRDHCLQYAVAIALLFGELKYEHYLDDIAKDKKIDLLRKKIVVREDKSYTRDYYTNGSCANRIVLLLKNGHKIGPREIKYPLGHKKRRAEAIPHLKNKFRKTLSHYFDKKRTKDIECVLEFMRLRETRVSAFLDLFYDA